MLVGLPDAHAALRSGRAPRLTVERGRLARWPVPQPGRDEPPAHEPGLPAGPARRSPCCAIAGWPARSSRRSRSRSSTWRTSARAGSSSGIASATTSRPSSSSPLASGRERFLAVPAGRAVPDASPSLGGLVAPLGRRPGVGDRLGQDARLVSWPGTRRRPLVARVAAPRARRRRRLRPRPRRAAARPGLLGHRRVPGRRPGPRHRPSHRLSQPTCSWAGSRRSCSRPVRRGRPPDEPVVAPSCSRRPRASRSCLVQQLTGSAPSAPRGGPRFSRSRRSPGGSARTPTRTRSTSRSSRRCWSCSSGWERRGAARAIAPGADRWLVAAAALYGVALGNHTLTLLLAPGIALFVLAVEPRILRRPRLVARCAVALARHDGRPVPRAADPRRRWARPSSTGTRTRWDGFWYIVLAEQFRGDATWTRSATSAQGSRRSRQLAGRSSGSWRCSCRPASSLTAVRRPRFALLTATWLVVTCWFAASYTTPTSSATTWSRCSSRSPGSAWPRGVLVELVHPLAGRERDAGRSATRARRRTPRRAGGDRLAASALAAALAASLVLAGGPGRARDGARIDLSRDTRPLTGAAGRSRPGPQRGRRQLVELLHAALVPDRRSSASGPTSASSTTATRLDEDLGGVDDVIRANLAAAAGLPRARLPPRSAALEASLESWR